MSHLRLILFYFSLLFSSVSFGADDIALISATISNLDLTYEKLPLSQAQGLTFYNNFNNIASFNHTGIYVNLKIIDPNNDTIYDYSSSPITVASQSIDSSQITIPFSATIAGTYTFIYVMFQDSLDAIPGNNTITTSLNVSDYLMQRDNGITTGPGNFGGSSGYYEIGNWMAILEPATITSASVVIDATTEVGAMLFFTLYDMSREYLVSTENYEISADDIGDTVTLYFTQPHAISSWDYVVVTAGNYGPKKMVVQMAQPSPVVSSYYVNDNYDWYYITTTPMVRINLDEPASIEANVSQISWAMFPNPTSSFVNVKVDDNQIHEIRVSDLTGKLIYSEKVYRNKTIDTKEFPAGIYLVQLDSQTSQKLIIN
jgi:hypothetical protein